MTMKLVFNECSLAPQRAKDVYRAREWMKQLLETLKGAKSMACGGSFGRADQP